jgi:hypothetical protein
VIAAPAATPAVTAVVFNSSRLVFMVSSPLAAVLFAGLVIKR